MIANELRIGNIILIETFDLKTETIVKKEIKVDATIFVALGYGAKHYYPIPLTPEILESCGFAKVDNDHLSDFIKETLHDVNFIISHNGYEYESFCIGLTHKKILGNDRDFMNFGIELRFLHQLQNLYFALEGTELEINLHVETHQ